MTASRARTACASAAAIVLFTGCQIHGLHLDQSPLLKYFARSSGEIAFIDLGGNVTVTDQTGKSRRITTDGVGGSDSAITYLSPTWSPNGRRLVFGRFASDDTGNQTFAQLFVGNSGSGEYHEVFSSTSLSPFYFSWSPDGTKVALLSSTKNDNRLEMGIVSVASPGSYAALDTGSPYYWTWGPSSETIYAHTNFTDRGGGRFTVIPISDPALRRDLKLHMAFFQAPEALQNGDVLATVRTASGGAEIAEVDAAGDETPVATTNPVVLFSLSPDKRSIAYVEPETVKGSATNILHVERLAAPRSSVAVGVDPVISYFWSPDSKRIAVFTPDRNPKTPDAMYSRMPNIPRVELSVYDVSAHRAWDIARFPVSQGLINVFPYIDQYQRSQTIWSPDSKSLVFTAYGSRNTPGVYVAQANGNIKPMRIADGDYATWSWN